MDEYTPKKSNAPEKSKSKTLKKVLLSVIISLSAALFITAGIVIALKYLPAKPEDVSPYLNEDAVLPELSDEPIDEEILYDNPINFEVVKKDFPDACAWIQMPGIEIINYPIVRSGPQEDDKYYLDRNAKGEKAREGAIFIQKNNKADFSDPNTLIYGHNMANGSMFGQLYDNNSKQFLNKEYFDEHRTIYVYTPGHILKYEVISAFVYDDRHILNSFDFDNEEERMEFFNTCTNPETLKNQVLEGATLEPDDKIITLSTCTNNKTERFLVVGKLVQDVKTK